MAHLIRGKNFEKNKSKVLHTVAKLFLAQGYHKTTLRQVSRESGVAYSSLINIFGSKEGILVELVSLVLEWQFLKAEELTREKTEDKILFYAAETVLQLHMAESHEHIREMYAVSYSLPETSQRIYDTVTRKLQDIFGTHLPHFKPADFYCFELASGGIMRSFMTVPCDMFFSMESKVRAFLQATLRIWLVPEEKIGQAIAFVSEFDFASTAQEVIESMLGYLKSQT